MSTFSIPVSDFMSSPVHSVQSDTLLAEVHKQMSLLGVSSFAVVDNGKTCGVVTRTDLLRMGRRQAGGRRDAALLVFPTKPVSEVMSKDIVMAKPDDTIEQTAQKMAKNGYHRIYIEEDGETVGVLSTRDIMLAIAQQRMNKPIFDFMSSPAFTVRATEPISLASERLAKAHVSGLIVVDEGWPVGLFTQTAALAAKDLSQETAVEDAMDSAMLLLDPGTPIFRAAAQAAAMDVRRVVVWDGKKVCGILTGLDFAKAARPTAAAK
jgi:predicted transcriptional regulator